MKRICLFLLGVPVLSSVAAGTSFAQSRGGSPAGPKAAARQNKLRAKGAVKFINPAGLAKPPGYTHVVEVTGGRTVYIAGQVALDPSGAVVGGGDFRAQTEQVFKNLKTALESVGASFKDVVRLNMYVTDASRLAALREVRDRYVNTSAPPASTLIEVRRLAREELMIEIEAVAVVPE